ncbi:hypothetical protein ACFYTG_32165 [Streptomyces mirabilis]
MKRTLERIAQPTYGESQLQGFRGEREGAVITAELSGAGRQILGPLA